MLSKILSELFGKQNQKKHIDIKPILRDAELRQGASYLNRKNNVLSDVGRRSILMEAFTPNKELWNKGASGGSLESLAKSEMADLNTLKDQFNNVLNQYTALSKTDLTNYINNEGYKASDQPSDYTFYGSAVGSGNGSMPVQQILPVGNQIIFLVEDGKYTKIVKTSLNLYKQDGYHYVGKRTDFNWTKNYTSSGSGTPENPGPYMVRKNAPDESKLEELNTNLMKIASTIYDKISKFELTINALRAQEGYEGDYFNEQLASFKTLFEKYNAVMENEDTLNAMIEDAKSLDGVHYTKYIIYAILSITILIATFKMIRK